MTADAHDSGKEDMKSTTDADESTAVHTAQPADAAAGNAETDGAEAAEQAAAPDAGAETRVEEELDRLRAENAELKDRTMRALAEVENIRRRAEQDRRNLVRYGVAPLAELLFPVADNLRRALDAASTGGEAQPGHFQALLDGVAMTERQLADALTKTGVVRVTPQPGEPFDYRYHQAMTEVADSPHPPGAIAYVMQDGYSLHDRLLRAAMVAVVGARAAQPTKNAAEKGGEDADGDSGEDGAGDARS